MLEGSRMGIEFYIKPDWSRLYDYSVSLLLFLSVILAKILHTLLKKN